MKTFPGWRNVGRAMRWARQQNGVTRAYDGTDWLEHEWDRNSSDLVRVGGRGGSQGYGFMVSLADGRHVETSGLSAGQILRVLAALDLIPAYLAEADDERYRRCETCGRMAQWAPPAGPFAERWCHLEPMRPFHRPQITDPTDLAEAGPATAPTQEHR